MMSRGCLKGPFFSRYSMIACALAGPMPLSVSSSLFVALLILIFRTPPTVTWLVGPEGGWTGAERASLVAAGAVPVRLAAHVLRTETAAVAGLVLLQAWCERWSLGPGDPAPSA